MKIRVAGSFLLALLLTAFVPNLLADTIVMRNGDRYEGIIEEIREGQVVVDINRQLMNFDIRDVESMSFDTPHLLPTDEEALDHFLSDIESQEIVENFAEMELAAAELRRMMEQVRRFWEAREPIETRETQAWEAARDQFRRPLSLYQELLNDVYFHVLARVDEYNAIAHEAGDIYVGVKGVFNIGSPLLPDGMGELSLRKYVPTSWYDTIYYDGYNMGYDDAYLRIQGERDRNQP